jgi:hypothetical protein
MSEAFPYKGKGTVLKSVKAVRDKDLAKRYEVPIQVYPEESPRSATIVGTAVDTMV